MSDARIDGQIVEFKTRPALSFPNAPIMVSGTVTCRFENDHLLDAVRYGRDADERYFAQIIARQHKADVWQRLRPILRRAALYLTLGVALSLAFVSGAF